MSKINLQTLGFTDKFAAEATLYSNLFAGRVTAQYKEFYRVMTEAGELLAEVSGKLRFNAAALSAFPAVGDFVMLDRTDNTEGQAIIHHVLGRKSAFIRKAAGTANVEQVVASNIDTVFICMSLNSDFNLRRQSPLPSAQKYLLLLHWQKTATARYCRICAAAAPLPSSVLPAWANRHSSTVWPAPTLLPAGCAMTIRVAILLPGAS